MQSFNENNKPLGPIEQGTLPEIQSAVEKALGQPEVDHVVIHGPDSRVVLAKRVTDLERLVTALWEYHEGRQGCSIGTLVTVPPFNEPRFRMLMEELAK